jgi:hypothetical protein
MLQEVNYHKSAEAVEIFRFFGLVFCLCMCVCVGGHQGTMQALIIGTAGSFALRPVTLFLERASSPATFWWSTDPCG